MYYALFDQNLDMNLKKQKKFKLLRKIRIANMLKVGKEHWYLYIHNQHKGKFREVSQENNKKIYLQIKPTKFELKSVECKVIKGYYKTWCTKNMLY